MEKGKTSLEEKKYQNMYLEEYYHLKYATSSNFLRFSLI